MYRYALRRIKTWKNFVSLLRMKRKEETVKPVFYNRSQIK